MVADEEKKEREERERERKKRNDDRRGWMCERKKENADRGEKAPCRTTIALFPGIVSSFCDGLHFSTLRKISINIELSERKRKERELFSEFKISWIKSLFIKC